MATHSSVLAWRILGTGAWWAAVYGGAQCRTQLKQLSSSKENQPVGRRNIGLQKYWAKPTLTLGVHAPRGREGMEKPRW